MDNNPQNLLFKYFSGSCSEEELRLVEEWIERSPQNREELFKMERIWFTRESEFNPDVARAWQSVNNAIGEPTLTVSHRRRPGLAWLSGIAAAVTLIIVGVYYWNTLPTWKHVASDDAAMQFELPDGSTAWMKENSQLSYRFDEAERAIELKGAVFFDVEKDASRPFRIDLQRSRIEVLGTSFLAETLTTTDRVRVKSGSVSFSDLQNEEKNFVLKPGDEAEFDLTSGDITRRPIADPNYLAWQTGVLVFNKTPLRTVIQSLVDHYQVSISFETDELGNCLITSKFENQSVEEVLSIIEKLLSAELIRTEKGYLLRGQGC